MKKKSEFGKFNETKKVNLENLVKQKKSEFGKFNETKKSEFGKFYCNEFSDDIVF